MHLSMLLHITIICSPVTRAMMVELVIRQLPTLFPPSLVVGGLEREKVSSLGVTRSRRSLISMAMMNV